MESAAQDTNSSVPSARFLQARITALSTALIKRLENIFAAALEEEIKPPPPEGTRADSSAHNEQEPYPPTLTDTAVKQLQLDVETTGLIRSAEELMVLTRSMKELWLFGGLETIPDENTPQSEAQIAIDKQIAEDEKIVVEGIKNFLDQLAHQDIANTALE